MFYCSPQWAPNVLTKIRNHDMSGWTWLKWGPGLHTSALRVAFVERTGEGTWKTKDSDTQVKI